MHLLDGLEAVNAVPAPRRPEIEQDHSALPFTVRSPSAANRSAAEASRKIAEIQGFIVPSGISMGLNSLNHQTRCVHCVTEHRCLCFVNPSSPPLCVNSGFSPVSRLTGNSHSFRPLLVDAICAQPAVSPSEASTAPDTSRPPPPPLPYRHSTYPNLRSSNELDNSPVSHRKCARLRELRDIPRCRFARLGRRDRTR